MDEGNINIQCHIETCLSQVNVKQNLSATGFACRNDR